MKIYVDYTNTPSFSKKGYLTLKENFNNVNWTDKIENSYDSDAIIVKPSFCSNDVLDKYPNLSFIQLITAGFDNIDLDYLAKRKIKLLNASDVFNIAIAEDVISKILYINKHMKFYEDNRKNKIWESKLVEYEIYGSTIGILGVGGIGIETAKRLKAFNTKILGYRRSIHKEEHFDEIYNDDEGLDHILKTSDYIILAIPLNDATHHLINKEKLSLMKESAVLINVARGEVVNQDDLIEILKNNKIRAAALDVVTPEPLIEDSLLWELDNVFLSPHSSNLSPYTEDRLVNKITKNLKKEME